MRGQSTGILLCDHCGSGTHTVHSVGDKDLCHTCELREAHQLIGKLRDALRHNCLGSLTNGEIGRTCISCGGMWGEGQPEEHGFGCLAALPDTQGKKH